MCSLSVNGCSHNAHSATVSPLYVTTSEQIIKFMEMFPFEAAEYSSRSCENIPLLSLVKIVLSMLYIYIMGKF